MVQSMSGRLCVSDARYWLRPAGHLAAKVVSGPAKVTKANHVRVNLVQGRKRFNKRAISLGAETLGALGQGRIPKYGARQIVHHQKLCCPLGCHRRIDAAF